MPDSRRCAVDGVLRSGRRVALLLLVLGLVSPMPSLAEGAAVPADSVLEISGEAVQGGLLIARAPAEARVRVDGKPVDRASDGTFLLGFGRDDEAPRRLVVEMPDGERHERVLRPGPREFDIQRIDGLPPSQVTPAPEALARIRAEARLVSEARQRRDDRTDFAAGFIWPVAGPVTGVYGSQRILNGEPRNPHWGIDIAAPVGTPVRAPAPGVVTLAHEDMYFSGGTLLLDHGLGLSSAFLHLEEILVEPGTRVEQGEVIARVGATGRVTGAHLDWRMNLGPLRVDPSLLLDGPPPEAGSGSD